MGKPKLLNGLTIIMGVLNLSGYLFISDGEATTMIEIVIITAIIVFSYWVLYKFHNGANWARILVMITSVIANLNLIFLMGDSFLISVVLIIEAMIGLFLLYWLNLKAVKTYFISKKQSE